MKTWKAEATVVAAVLYGTAAAKRGGLVEWWAASTVLVTFFHAQVGFRLSEAAARPDLLEGPHEVTCHAWSTRYFVAKEVMWSVTFALLGSWSALAGVCVFMVYPGWRRYWLARKARRIAGVADRWRARGKRVKEGV